MRWKNASLWVMPVLFSLIACRSEKEPQTEKKGTFDIAVSDIEDSEFDVLSDSPECPLPTSPLRNMRPAEFVDQWGARTTLSEKIAGCVIIRGLKSQCTVGELDFLLPIEGSIGIEQVFERLLVTAPWMADRFKESLALMPSDLIALFGSVTAIVVHPDISHGFFFPATGALYLSPVYLAQTAEELQQAGTEIAVEADCLKTDDWPVQFISRYSRAGEVIFYDVNARQAQAIQGWLPEEKARGRHRYPLAALLFHELIHARDYFPSEILEGRNAFATPDYLRDSTGGFISSALRLAYPKDDSTLLLTALAATRYQQADLDPLVEQAGTSAVIRAFDLSGANDLYAFVNQREDLAMLGEAFLMKYHFDLDREIAWVGPEQNLPASCANTHFHSVAVNRMFDPLVLPRLAFALEQLFDSRHFDTHQFLPALPPASSWCQ